MEIEHLTKMPLEMAGLSYSFLAKAKMMGFETLDEIFSTKRDELIRREGFTFHWLSELISFLQERNALHLLQPGAIRENAAG